MAKKISLTKADRMAPGHAYIHSLGTGIEWKPGMDAEIASLRSAGVDGY